VVSLSRFISTFVSKMKIFSNIKIVKPIHQISANGTHDRPVLPYLYFHANDYQWFKKTFPRDWNIDIRCWRLVDSSFTKKFVPNNLFGRLVVMVILWVETVFPHLSVKISSYPMIIIRKN